MINEIVVDICRIGASFPAGLSLIFLVASPIFYRGQTNKIQIASDEGRELGIEPDSQSVQLL